MSNQVYSMFDDPNSEYNRCDRAFNDGVNAYIRKYGCAGSYSTNYFGSRKGEYLARPTADSFELIKNAERKRKRENFFICACTAVAGFFSLKSASFLINKISPLLKKTGAKSDNSIANAVQTVAKTTTASANNVANVVANSVDDAAKTVSKSGIWNTIKNAVKNHKILASIAALATVGTGLYLHKRKQVNKQQQGQVA